MASIQYKLIVGLEIHVQLATQTKLFCGCAVGFGGSPNSRVCPVCLGLPGSLPVMNRKAVEFAILTGLALNCRINQFTKWDRKSYYYPDLPKNYQISQYDLPVAVEGYIEIPSQDGGVKKVRIRRVHLEEDAGKNTHTLGAFSAVDLNRAGTPLLEIVTEPDMNSPQEVRALAEELQRIVRYLGVSQADMQKGHMRFEPNVNLHIVRDGQLFKTPITEIKNLNSFRSIERSIAYETQRQLDEFLTTGRTLQSGNKSTYGWDDATEQTILQREKEEAHDYRYFPDPDLVPVVVSDVWLEEIRRQMVELPLAMQQRFVREYGLSDYDAGVLTADRATAVFFDQAVRFGAQPKRVCNLLTQTGLKIANDRQTTVDRLGFSAQELAELAQLADSGQVSATAAAMILEHMANGGGAPQSIAERLNLLQQSDISQIEKWVLEVLSEQPQAVADAKENPKKAKKALGFLTGQVIQKSKGKANPKLVAEVLEAKLQVL